MSEARSVKADESAVVVKVVGIVALSAVAILVRGLVISQLWSWFVTIHFGLAPISIPEALGISLMLGFVTSAVDTSKSEGFASKLGFSISYSLAMWATGWLIFALFEQSL